MNKKIRGQKNELDNNEKRKYQDKLKGKYKICSQLGITGDRSSAYLMQDETGAEFVLKIPNDDNDFNWIKNQKDTIEKFNTALNNYDGDVYIPNPVIFDNEFIVEEYAGSDLVLDLYDNLSNDEKDKIGNDFAYFLYYLHANNNIGGVLPLQMFNKPTLDEVFDYLQNTFDIKEQLYISEKIKYFNNRDTSDEISVMTHADIRSQNVLYNQKQKKLAIIDFELLKERNIYHDFVPFAAASFNLPYKLLFEIVDKYNLLAGKANISISPEKVKLFHELGVFHECGRCAIYRKDKDEQLKNMCQRVFTFIDNISIAIK